MAFRHTTAIKKLRKLKKRKRVIQGGTWAGKTYGILPVIIDYCIKHEGEAYTVVAESIPAIKKGALKDFKEVMQLTGRWIEENFHATDRKYTFANGSYIEFSSFSSVGDAQAAGKRTGLFINEANYIPFPIADALMTRTSGNIWIDYNPTASFWAHEELIGDDGVDFIILKYTDNEGLPETILEDLMIKKGKAFHNVDLPTDQLYKESNVKSKFWANWCKVYLDGLVGNLEGIIFQEGINWEIIDSIPEGLEMEGLGLDFGYTNDPTALIGGYKYNGTKIYDELIYKTRMLNSHINDSIESQGIDKNKLIIADSAEPKSIDDLILLGLNVMGATKGKDSVINGITNLQEIKFYFTSISVNIIKELRNYCWKVNKEGVSLNIPVDAYNHGIDAIRYHESDKTEFWAF